MGLAGPGRGAGIVSGSNHTHGDGPNLKVGASKDIIAHQIRLGDDKE